MKQRNFRFYHSSIGDYTHYSVRLFGVSCWAYYSSDGFKWFRLFGIGLGFKDLTKFAMMFSERNGYTKHIILGKWLVRCLY